jgi:hypothetical protein
MLFDNKSVGTLESTFLHHAEKHCLHLCLYDDK